MPAKRLTMRKIKEVLRLRYEVHLSHRDIHQALNIGYGTVVDYLQRAKVAGVEWPLAESMDERTLGRLLLPSSGESGQQAFVDLDYLAVHQELKRPHVTKLPLWEEYRQPHPVDGYSYAQFCARCKAWQHRQVLLHATTS
jgi:transposase